jgi:hypothetical protein
LFPNLKAKNSYSSGIYADSRTKLDNHKKRKTSPIDSSQNDSSDENGSIKKLKENTTIPSSDIIAECNNNNKNFKFNQTTRFVLGKNVNEIYAILQQGLNDDSSSLSTTTISTSTSMTNTSTTTTTTSSSTQLSNNTNNNNNPNPNIDNNQQKSIYSKYPHLFRYEADQLDRHWLFDKAIIKRKNLKCYVLVLDDVLEMFMVALKLDNCGEMVKRLSEMLGRREGDANEGDEEDLVGSESGGEEAVATSSSSLSTTNKSPLSQELLYRKLKPFCLPDSILYKLNRQYFKNKLK